MKKTFPCIAMVSIAIFYCLSAGARCITINNNNPTDTSAPDLARKIMESIIGGAGISAADSATAIKAFMLAKGGSGYFYQTVTSITTAKTGTRTDTSSRYFTNGGEARSEMNLAGMMGARGGSPLVVLARADHHNYSIILDAVKKTYSLNIIDTSLINGPGKTTYQVTKVGTETVQGYNCVHAKLVSKLNAGLLKSSSTMDIWTSTDVPGYSMIKNKINDRQITLAMMEALDQAGCNGFFVKMTTQGKDYSSTMLLIRAQPKTFPASLFQVPAGYSASNESIMSYMMGARQ